MAVKVKMMKATARRGAGVMRSLKANDTAPGDYVLHDNEDGSFDVHGIDDKGNDVDISAVAQLTPAPSSEDESVLTVDAIDPSNPMRVVCHGVKAGNTNVVVTATWNDGSVGPFEIKVPADVGGTSPKIVGIGVTFGTPTIRG